MKKVRVRFAPSPTGGLHLGGVRTALFNYLFARQNGGDFVLRIEDTDRTRYVEGAEQYILDCLKWSRLMPDEGPYLGGEFGPYRQSERKEIYREYAEKLVQSGHAYYAFDSPEEIELMRVRLKQDGKDNLQYGADTRMEMKNSLTLSKEETQQLLEENVPHVIRIKVEKGETVKFTDMIRGALEMTTDSVDDKVLLKADGMPTYHLAVVVDDYLMKISHVFRGEEWLPSAPVHVLLYQYLGWENEMPQWAHFPLILKPDGNGKLSKRDGERLGFPVFALEWNDPVKGSSEGFKEIGFVPEAFVNMLALLGWNDGSEQEIFSLDELVQKFSMDRVHSHGAKFDFEKAKWFNHEWLMRLPLEELTGLVKPLLEKHEFDLSDEHKLRKVVELVRERCALVNDFVEQTVYFYKSPMEVDLSGVQPKWNAQKAEFFSAFAQKLVGLDPFFSSDIEKEFKTLAGDMNLKSGELMMVFRIMLVGAKYGAGVFDIADVIGKQETVARIKHTLGLLA